MHKQSKRKKFLSTCPWDKHHIKFACQKPKNLKLKNNRAFNVFNHIITFVNNIVFDLNLKQSLHFRQIK